MTLANQAGKLLKLLQFSALTRTRKDLRTIIKTFAELRLTLPPARDQNFIGSTTWLASVLIRPLAMPQVAFATVDAAVTAFRAAR